MCNAYSGHNVDKSHAAQPLLFNYSIVNLESCCLRFFAHPASANVQHPMVYKVSSAWDSVTAESDMAIGIKELRRLDPSFHVEDWKADIQELFLPEFISAFLRVSKEQAIV